MSDVVRRGTIIIDLQQGRTEIKAPDLRQLLGQQERELALTKEIEQAQRQLNETRQQGFSVSTSKPTLPPGLAGQLPPEWGGTAGGGGMGQQADAAEKAAEATAKVVAEIDKWAAGVEKIGTSALPQVDRWREGMERIGEQTAAQAAASEQASANFARQSNEAQKAMAEVAEGAMFVTRGMVLLGLSGDESLESMVRGLAKVQAGFDMFKGAVKIVENVEKAKVALAAATAANSAAMAAETTAKTANTAATVAMTTADYAAAAAKKALAAATNPVVLGIAALVGVVWLAVEAVDALHQSEEELREEQEKNAANAQQYMDFLRERAALQREVADLERETMTAAERADSLRQSAGMSRAEASNFAHDASATGRGPGSEAALLGNARASAQSAARDLQEEKRIREQILADELKQRDAQIQRIQNQQRIVEGLREELAAEKEKVTTFQAQAGQLTQAQQARLRDIRDKLLAGDDISRHQEKFLAQHGGDPGAEIVRRRQAARGADAGFDENFFKGIDGGERMADDLNSAAKELAEAAKKLAELSDGGTAAAKIAELEQEKDQLRQASQEFIAEWNKQFKQVVAEFKSVNKRLDELGFANIANK